MFLTNPNIQFHVPASKEDIKMNKGEIAIFQVTNQYELKTENAFIYSSVLVKQLAIKFGLYGTTTKALTVKTVNELAKGKWVDPTELTLGGFKNLHTSWNDITPEAIHNNVTITWGNKIWTTTRDKKIVAFFVEQDELQMHDQVLVLTIKLERQGKEIEYNWIG